MDADDYHALCEVGFQLKRIADVLERLVPPVIESQSSTDQKESTSKDS